MLYSCTTQISLLLALAVVETACGRLSDQERFVKEVRFNASGDLLISANEFLAAYDPELKKERFGYEHGPNHVQTTFVTVEGSVRFLDVLLDAATAADVAVVVIDGSVVVFNAKTGKRTLSITGEQLDIYPELPLGGPSAVTLSPNGGYVAVVTQGRDDSGLYRNHLNVFRTSTGELLWRREFKEILLRPLFWGSGDRVWVREYDHVTRAVDSSLFTAESGALEAGLPLQGLDATAHAQSDDRATILGWLYETAPMGPLPYTARAFPAIWRATDGGLISSFPSLGGFNCGLPSAYRQLMASSPDGQLFAALLDRECDDEVLGIPSEDVLVVWNREGQVLHWLRPQTVESITFSPDGTKLAVAHGLSGASVYRMSDGALIGRRKFYKELF